MGRLNKNLEHCFDVNLIPDDFTFIRVISN